MKIRTLNENAPYVTYSGYELNDVKAPSGIYRNVDRIYKGYVVKDNVGYLTYFDVEHGCISAYDVETWGSCNFQIDHVVKNIVVDFQWFLG